MGWKSWMAAALAILGSGVVAQPMPVPAPLVPPVTIPATVPVEGPARPLTGEDVNAWLDGFMPYALRSGDIAGAVVTVVQNGQVIAAKGYGYADIAKRRPVDPARTLFRPGSVSKLVTWTAVMQQVEAGKIDLDADINRYLDFTIPPRNGKPVTMRQVLTHTAGFEEAIKELITLDPKRAVANGEYLKRWTPTRIFDAGTTPAYSNWATTLAGYVVERTSGMRFDDYVDQRIFAPLGMTTATFRQPLPARLAPLISQGYPRASVKPEPFEIVVAAPAGSLSASGLDMAKFMIAHLANGRGILAPATAAAMHQSSLAKVDPRSLIPPLNRMELGFFETNINGREVIAHLGDTQNMHTSLHLFLREGVGLYVSFNSAGRERASGTARAQLFQDFADRYFPATARDGRVDAATARKHAEMMGGLWMNSRRSESNFFAITNLLGQVKVGVDEDGALLIPDLHGPGGAPQKWVEIAPFVWRDTGGHDRLAAQVRNGRVVRWSFDMISPFMVFERVPASLSAGWLLPAIYASLAVLLLTALYWPSTWWLRRRYAQSLKVEGHARRAYRATHLMAWAVLGVLAAWTAMFVAMSDDISLLGPAFDSWVWIAKAAAIIVLFGAVAIAAWNAWLTWRDGRRWTAKLWAALVLVATLVILYTAWAFGVLALSVNY